MAISTTHNGWHWDRVNSRLDFYYRGTRVGDIGASTMNLTVELSTSHHVFVTANDVRVAAGNLRLGGISAFATTDPTCAVVMKQGTAPSGAITTSGGLYTDGTVIKKIIAAGTASNVET